MKEITISKSRFIAYAAPAGTQEAALNYLHGIQSEHPGASHHCFAYIIGANAGIMRYSDDGEPAGTAGLPIMSLLKTRQLCSVCAVVVRYFGGVLLGAGGLLRAYQSSCALALDAAGAILMSPSLRLRVAADYALWDKLQRHLESLPLIVEDIRYAEAVSAKLILRQSDAGEIIASITSQAQGRADLVEVERLYFGWPLTDARA
ncbi:MAG: YigZ family protein [Christensenellales bacterium]